MKKTIMAIAATAGLAAFAQGHGGPGGRDAFMRQQAYEEVQRVAGQVDLLESNQAALSERLGRLERGGGEINALRAEIDALKAELARLRAEMGAQRQAIVADIVKRIPKNDPAPMRQLPPPPVYSGPREEYVVQPGDTLSLIAQAFGTTVPKIKEMNSLRGDMLRPGQKIIVPGQGGQPRRR
jgi:LysM repeat protein